ncbi:MAG: sigma 54-interacting transcriptional regulator, partial [Planctomycetaceae bacterium]
MCLVTMGGFVGGFHWWVVAGRLWLTIPFAISAMLVPVVTLHFFCLFPEPKPWLHERPWLAPLAIYALPVTATAALVAGILWINANHLLGRDPLPLRVWLGWLVTGIHWCLGLAATCFALTLLALVDSLRTARNPLQQRQVAWILWAALLATIPVGYTLYLARFDPEGFALGSATIPMFAASLLLMAAYAVGILRYKLTLIDEVVQRGGWYLALRAGLTVAMLLSELAVCGLGLYQQSRFPMQTPMVLMLVIALLLLLHLVRDRLTRWIDLRMIGERFQLDRAMQPLIQSAGGGQNPEQIARRLLASCRELLGVDRAALYLRETDEGAFPLVAVEQLERAPLRFSSDSELLELLEAETAAGSTADNPGEEIPAGLRILRELDVEIVHALEDSGKLAGALMLGPKRNGTRFNDDDLVLLTSLGQVLQLALRGAQVRQVMTRLNEELRLKTARLAEQQRLIALLQAEITSRATPTAVTPPASDETPFRRDSIKGSSPPMLTVLDTVRKVSGSQSSVLVRGESGTGKELLALALHDNSPRRNGPLVSVNCGALSAGLLESELFGHVKGAFTGAHRDKVGRFEMAHGGTLFLDEIGDISLETQVKLLRVLQEREFEPVGGNQTIKVDVRLIAATHQDLESLIAQGRFR